MKTLKHSKPLLFLLVSSAMIASCSKGGGGTKPKTNATDTVYTVAGTGSAGTANGTGTAASFTFPSSIVFAGNGVMVIGDFGNSLIRSLAVSSGAVGTIAGTGTEGLVNGPVTAAEFNGPANIALDASGNLFIADEQNNVIREITTTGNVTTVAGNGIAGYTDGPAASAQFNSPEAMAFDNSGNLYVADDHNHAIRKINLTTNAVSTYAGTGVAGFANGAVASATFNEPYGLAKDISGNLYVTDVLNNCIRKIDLSSGMVSTYAGTGTQGMTNGAAATATFYHPLGCTFDSGNNLYVADSYNNVIRRVSSAVNVITFAGSGFQGAANGPAATASFNFPIGVLVYTNYLYVADTHNDLIRKILIAQ